MLNYKFGISRKTKHFNSKPYIDISDPEGEIGINEYMHLNSKLNHLSSEYIRQIVQELEEVKSRERCEFGFETTLVWVYKVGFKNENVNFPNGKIFITYHYGDFQLETPLTIDDILKMMTDYRDYVDAWEKETGKVKK